MEAIKIGNLKVGDQKRFKKTISTLAVATVGIVGFDGEYYYVCQQSYQITLNFIQQIIYGGFENYNKKNEGIFKAYRFRTKSSAEKKLNSFV